MRKFRISVEGVPYNVTVEELTDGSEPSTKAMSPSLASAATGYRPPTESPVTKAAIQSAPGDIVSSLAGVITTIEVTVGTQVKEGDPLLHLEAMKMNTAVVAPRAGMVKNIAVSAGIAVHEGQVLMTLE
ncbi:MAG: biotin/lipoyl-binding protein [Rhodospirillales bacterium]|nr:biotin/lipoyl-binding protein [Rhodospirillales bacterium]